MTTTSSISATSPTSSTASATYGYASLGANDFLKMLTAELTQQDPTEPSDEKQMVSQLATFSSLSQQSDTNTGIGTTNTTLASIADKLDTLIAAQAASGSAAA